MCPLGLLCSSSQALTFSCIFTRNWEYERRFYMNSLLALRPIKTTEVVAETIRPRLPFKLLSNEILDIIHQINFMDRNKSSSNPADRSAQSSYRTFNTELLHSAFPLTHTHTAAFSLCYVFNIPIIFQFYGFVSAALFYVS